MTQQFDDPGSQATLSYADLDGKLLLFDVNSLEDDVRTAYSDPNKKNPAVRANVTVIDGPDSGTVYEDALVFPKLLVGQLRTRVGRSVLGRLGKGQAFKSGQNQPWKLFPATEEDRKKAEGAVSGSNTPGGQSQAQAPF
jgi:hypothetical protein